MGGRWSVAIGTAAALAGTAAAAQDAAFPLDAPAAPLFNLCASDCAGAIDDGVTVTLGAGVSRVDPSSFTPNPRRRHDGGLGLGAGAQVFGFDFTGAYLPADATHEERMSLEAGYDLGGVRIGGGLSLGLGDAEGEGRGEAGLGLGLSLGPGLSVDGGVSFSEAPQTDERSADVEAGVRMRFDF